MNTVTFNTNFVSFMNENERKSLVIDGIPIDMQKQVIIMSGKGGPKTIGIFKVNEAKRFLIELN